MNGPCPLGQYGAKTCFVATAAYGSQMANELNYFYRFRDGNLAKKRLGRFLVKMYYKVGPSLAKIVSASDKIRAVTRKVVLDPFVKHFRKYE